MKVENKNEVYMTPVQSRNLLLNAYENILNTCHVADSRRSRLLSDADPNTAQAIQRQKFIKNIADAIFISASPSTSPRKTLMISSKGSQPITSTAIDAIRGAFNDLDVRALSTPQRQKLRNLRDIVNQKIAQSEQIECRALDTPPASASHRRLSVSVQTRLPSASNATIATTAAEGTRNRVESIAAPSVHLRLELPIALADESRDRAESVAPSIPSSFGAPPEVAPHDTTMRSRLPPRPETSATLLARATDATTTAANLLSTATPLLQGPSILTPISVPLPTINYSAEATATIATSLENSCNAAEQAQQSAEARVRSITTTVSSLAPDTPVEEIRLAHQRAYQSAHEARLAATTARQSYQTALSAFNTAPVLPGEDLQDIRTLVTSINNARSQEQAAIATANEARGALARRIHDITRVQEQVQQLKGRIGSSNTASDRTELTAALNTLNALTGESVSGQQKSLETLQLDLRTALDNVGTQQRAVHEVAASLESQVAQAQIAAEQRVVAAERAAQAAEQAANTAEQHITDLGNLLEVKTRGQAWELFTHQTAQERALSSAVNNLVTVQDRGTYLRLSAQVNAAIDDLFPSETVPNTMIGILTRIIPEEQRHILLSALCYRSDSYFDATAVQLIQVSNPNILIQLIRNDVWISDIAAARGKQSILVAILDKIPPAKKNEVLYSALSYAVLANNLDIINYLKTRINDDACADFITRLNGTPRCDKHKLIKVLLSIQSFKNLVPTRLLGAGSPPSPLACTNAERALIEEIALLQPPLFSYQEINNICSRVAEQTSTDQTISANKNVILAVLNRILVQQSHQVLTALRQQLVQQTNRILTQIAPTVPPVNDNDDLDTVTTAIENALQATNSQHELIDAIRTAKNALSLAKANISDEQTIEITTSLGEAANYITNLSSN